jgi:hypothetical protein
MNNLYRKDSKMNENKEKYPDLSDLGVYVQEYMEKWLVENGYTIAPEQSGMTFMEAVEAMKDGKKVKRGEWARGTYIYIDKRTLTGLPVCWVGGSFWVNLMDDIEATDWQILK